VPTFQAASLRKEQTGSYCLEGRNEPSDIAEITCKNTNEPSLALFFLVHEGAELTFDAQFVINFSP
jgi:hypothetical protein